MFVNVKQAYDQGTKTTVSGRQLEAGALFKAARRLEECQEKWNAPDSSERLHDALAHNQRLWTFFQSELVEPDHGLPMDLRRDILRLSLFIDRRTIEVIAEPYPEKLTALIEINRHIAAGLSANVAAAGARMSEGVDHARPPAPSPL